MQGCHFLNQTSALSVTLQSEWIDNESSPDAEYKYVVSKSVNTSVGTYVRYETQVWNLADLGIVSLTPQGYGVRFFEANNWQLSSSFHFFYQVHYQFPKGKRVDVNCRSSIYAESFQFNSSLTA